MGMSIDDSVKQKLLNSLAEEPTMVLSTAYAYAKNYVRYGEDITKAWTTAVQQSSILEKARKQAWVEAYDSFKSGYAKRLKADLVAMLEVLRLQAEENIENIYEKDEDNILMLAQHNAFADCFEQYNSLIEERIDALKGEEK